MRVRFHGLNMRREKRIAGVEAPVATEFNLAGEII
jgi:hypothetical protein